CSPNNDAYQTFRKNEIDAHCSENTTNKNHHYFHYSFSPIANIIVIIVTTTAHKTPKSKKVAVCISIGFKITNAISKGVCVKKILLYNQLAIGVAKQKNKPIPMSFLKSHGYILRIVLISNATEMITSELDNNKPPTKPPPGV